MDEVVELAPLMFVLLAEGCLARRRERLAEAEAVMGRMEELAREHRELYFLKYLGRIQDGYWQEHQSVQDRDLLGRVVQPRSRWLEERLSDASRAHGEEYEQWLASLLAEIDDIRLEPEESPDGDASADDTEDRA